MKNEAYVPDPLNEQASVLVDAQTDIKTAIKQGVLSGASFALVQKKVKTIIDKALKKISSATLKEDARISLMRFASAAYGRFARSVGTIPKNLLPAVLVLMRAVSASGEKGKTYYPKTDAERVALRSLRTVGNGGAPITFETKRLGLPLEEFHKVYMDRVSNALDELFGSYAFDPNDWRTDVEKKNSLRNLAEMQVRYERHQKEISGFRENGTKLVVCSVHADCSGRCAPWQGLVYSLDGTSGKTPDGRDYQPLENATDVFYTTKAGRTYKNGLLGFNCRHKLFQYKVGMGIPTVSKERQKREYAVTKRQRELEREVVYARKKALGQKGANVQEYRKWQRIAKARNEEYIRFSKEHRRPYYPDRIKIL